MQRKPTSHCLRRVSGTSRQAVIGWTPSLSSVSAQQTPVDSAPEVPE